MFIHDSIQSHATYEINRRETNNRNEEINLLFAGGLIPAVDFVDVFSITIYKKNRNICSTTSALKYGPPGVGEPTAPS